jgi:hypothetical protein
VGTASAAQSVYLTNTGSVPLNLLTPSVTLTSSQGAAADFQVSGYNGYVVYGCGANATLTPQGQCWLNVSFTPSAAATETATLTIPIAGSPTVFTVSLIGQGAASTQVLEFQPGNWIFPDQPVGTASGAEQIQRLQHRQHALRGGPRAGLGRLLRPIFKAAPVIRWPPQSRPAITQATAMSLSSLPPARPARAPAH